MPANVSVLLLLLFCFCYFGEEGGREVKKICCLLLQEAPHTPPHQCWCPLASPKLTGHLIWLTLPQASSLSERHPFLPSSDYSAVCNHVWVWDERQDICFCYEMVLRRDSVSELLVSQHGAWDMTGLQKELVELRDEEKYQVFRTHQPLCGQTAVAVCLQCLLCFGGRTFTIVSVFRLLFILVPR